MSKHEDLPLLVALDTYTGNNDRSLANIFYSPQAHHFYGIDQAASFKNNLAYFACQRVRELIERNYFKPSRPSILKALTIYYGTLKKLCTSDNLVCIQKTLSRCNTEHIISSRNVPNNKLAAYLTVAEESHKDTKTLLKLLESILNITDTVSL